MDRDKYFMMCEELGQEPVESEIPPAYEDFPTEVHTAYKMFNDLPDNYTGGQMSIFSGKDYTALPVLFELYSVSSEDRLGIFRIINYLDSKARQKAIKDAEAAAKKAKAKM